MKQIALIGSAINTAMQAPVTDDSWDFMNLASNLTIKELTEHCKRSTLFIEIHKREYNWEHYAGLLKEVEVPVLMQERYCGENKEIPTAEPYPRELIQKHFDKYFRNKLFVTCSVPWMLAWCKIEGYDLIGMFGLDFLTNKEYLWERPSICWWIGHLQALGIEFIIPDGSGLIASTYEYGFDSKPDELMEIHDRIMGLKKGKEGLQVELDKIKERMNKQVGAIEQCEYFERRYNL
jgi:hypothetical protein